MRVRAERWRQRWRQAGRQRWRLTPIGLVAGLVALAPAVAAASPAAPTASSAAAAASAGRPKVKLDHLSFPSIENASYYKKHLERSLRRAARAADWGAGAGSVIEYRFRVDSLEVARGSGVIEVSCSATGELPGGKSANGAIRFGGAPNQKKRLLRQVLRIVAEGVITRLAEIEHRRRAGS